MSDTRERHITLAGSTISGGGYVAPAITWVEVMEEAGVYAACAKDAFEPIGAACLSAPQSGAS